MRLRRTKKSGGGGGGVKGGGRGGGGADRTIIIPHAAVSCFADQPAHYTYGRWQVYEPRRGLLLPEADEIVQYSRRPRK